MTATRFTWEFEKEGLRARLRSDAAIPVDEWISHTLRTESGGIVHPGPLFRALDTGSAEILPDHSLRVEHRWASRLSIQDMRRLQLPARIDWPLVVRLEGLPLDPSAQAEWHFEGPKGRPLLPEGTIGCVAQIDGAFRLLPGSVFDAVAAISDYNATQGEERSTRLSAWATVAEALPEEAQVGEFLKEIRVCLADAFTIQPFINQDGEVDFDPIPGVWELSEDVEGEGQEDEQARHFAARLPEGPARRFRDLFRASGPRTNLPLKGGWYLTLPSTVGQMLEAVKELQDASAAERLSFLRNPEATLRMRVEHELAEAVGEIFASEDFSDRVEGTGIWKPPVLPWIRKEPQKWLPEERLGVRIGDTYVSIDPEDIESLLEKVHDAQTAGRPTVPYKGAEIPATEEAQEALNSLRREVQPSSQEEGSSGKGDGSASARVVLLVSENFHDVDYRREGSTRVGKLPCQPSELELNFPPKNYQEKGIGWLQAHWLDGSTGALLADDMGLGKTYQLLAFLRWLRRPEQSSRISRAPFLVVAPTGLLENWVEEHEKHLVGEGLGEVTRAYGRELRDLRDSAGKESEVGVALLDLRRLRESHWVLTTYETLRDYQHSFARVRFTVAALDEVQKAKNPRSGISQAMKTIKADFTVCSTGTPVENRLADLWNILDIARPGELGSLKEFSATFERETADDPSALQLLSSRLTEGTPAVMLRRMKTDHLDGLPVKREHFPQREMPSAQQRAYDQALAWARSRSQAGGKGAMLKTLGELRSISLHPTVQRDESDEEYLASSARLSLAFEALDEIHSKEEKALMFVEAREMQATLAPLIQRRYGLSRRPMIISGAVSGPKRQERVNRFQKEGGFDVLILSPRAGGVGLTLTAANHVIHLSRWWNPAVEDQCTDRVYRIGQEKRVHVHHPIAVHPELGESSFDVLLDRLLRQKRELSGAVLAPSDVSKQELEAFYRDVTALGTHGKSPTEVDWSAIDTVSPEGFEDWVLDQFRRVGYLVSSTPRSGDAGIDGVARPPKGSSAYPVLIQCKHTQVGRPCGEDAVIALVEGADRYERDGPRALAVVTNAPRFSGRAERVAREQGVRLVGRDRLPRIGQLFSL